MKRRDFIEASGKLTLSAGIFALPAERAGNREPRNDIFVHHVFFWLKEPVNDRHIEPFQKALLELVKIASIKSFHLGKPADTRREVIDSSYQYSLLTVFDNRAAHDEYQVHPVHNAFRKVVEELCNRVLVYDSINF